MAELNINGRMSVKKLKQQFKEAFGASLRVYNGKELADDDARLASIRTGDAKGGELSVRGNMKVGGFEKKMLEIYGISVQVADAADTQLVPDDVTIASVARFQSGDTPVAEPAPVPEPAVPAAAPAPAIDIDRLIDAALMDGVVTEKERAILIKKAVAQGIDPDEFEMILDAKILEKGASTPPVAPAVHAAALAAAAAAKKAEEEAAAQKAAAEAEAKAKAEAEAKAKAEAEAKAKAEAEAKAKAEAEAKAQAEAEAKAQAKKSAKAIEATATDDGKYMCVAKTGQTLYFNPVADHPENVVATSPYEGMWDEEPVGDLEIPEKISVNGTMMTVTGIDKAAFFTCKQLTSVVMLESITMIGENAFKECVKMTKVVALGVTTIGSSAFHSCSALVELQFPQATSIGDYAFKSCGALVNVQFPQATSIGKEAFYGCGKLSVAQFPKLENLGESSFHYCKSLEQFTIAAGVTFISHHAFERSGLKKIIIPNGVTQIGYDSFYDSKLEKVIIPSSVVKIDCGAFKSTKLTSVILPNRNVKFGKADPEYSWYRDSGNWTSDSSYSFGCSVTFM